ncbi:serine hydrolase domain-containing protein [Ideonella sp.]|uniref:serine hydrolase domain-containing protein n=1 Tax=Ideonella sp. TaxID=1929293 RepID=UPI003BB540CE
MTSSLARHVLCGLALLAAHWPCAAAPTAEAIASEVSRQMAATQSKGLALAVIEDGRVSHLHAAGQRNAQGEPLQTNTIMYGASLTKAVVAYTVMQLVEEGLLDLDTSIERYLPRPLPDYPTDRRYAPWSDLKGDERWRRLTPRMLLSHRAGFANFAFVEPDGKLRFHFEPGSRYAYSGEGYILMQFVLEVGLQLDLGREIQRRVFDRFGMTRTSMTWRPDFAANLADGYTAEGKLEPHDERSKVRAAGSMDTTLEDFAKFAAGYMQGSGLSARSRAELTRAQWPITTARQFPSLAPELPPAARRPDLGAGLGVIVFDGPQGHGFFKGGHNDSTGNLWVCLERSRRCVVLLANDVRAEAAFPKLVQFILGDTGVPLNWEYGPPITGD